MKILLSLEYCAGLILAVVLALQMSYSFWWFIVLFLTPDFGMVGYLINPKIGAFTYNFIHHLGIAVLLYVVGLYMGWPAVQFYGTIVLGHIFFDRTLGYGLKYTDAFKHTHLDSSN